MPLPDSPNAKLVKSLSSMATRALLTDLARSYEETTGAAVSVESVGGVEAAKRIAGGETVDVIVLAREALAKLGDTGHLLAGTQVDFVRSRLAVAIRAGQPIPALATREELQQALRQARAIGYSTGPSGVALADLFRRWGLAEDLRDRIVIAPPGVGVGTLVARGDVDLGFQQHAELIHLEGVEVLTELPPELAIVTVFSAATCIRSSSQEAARAWLTYMTSPATLPLKRRHGLEAA